MARALFATVLLLMLVAAAACSPRGDRPASNRPAPGAILPPPAVALARTFSADQGLAFEATAFVADRRGGEVAVSIDYGDGTVEEQAPSREGRVVLRHTYREAGPRTLAIRAAGAGGESLASAVVSVAPRYVLFVQGMNSQSSCPGGQRFLDRAPAWLGPFLAQDATLRSAIRLDAANFVYFSYSGRYCGGGSAAPGAVPDYGSDDTCGAIASSAGPRLRALIDALPPGRVTIVAHSMGGIVSAWAVASDPAWARARVASVATFDSPLGGLDRLRTTVLGFLALTSDRCSAGSGAIADLADGSRVLATAGQAAKVVPFYTLDGSSDESQALGLAEAVQGADTSLPGERLHWRIDEEHSEVWSRAPAALSTVDKRRFVACAILDDSICRF